MKQEIHPAYLTKTTITCSCGAVLETGSTQKDLQTEICSQCHPFYTGKKKVVDTTGRVDRFKKLSAKAAKAQEEHSKNQAKKATRAKEQEEKAVNEEKKEEK